MQEYYYHAIDPVMFHLGSFQVRWYGVAYFVTMLFVGVVGSRMAKRYPQDFPENTFWDMLPWVVLGMVAGGRLGDMLFYSPRLFLTDPLFIFRIWEPGLSFHGGLIGVVLALIFFCRTKKISIIKLLDAAAVLAPAGILLVRMGNFINGELYGRVTDVAWAVVFPSGGEAPRHPSQLYEGFLEGGVLFVVLWFSYPKLRARPGEASSLFLILYGIARYFAEFFREPDAIGFLSVPAHLFSMGQFLSLLMVVAGVFVRMLVRRR